MSTYNRPSEVYPFYTFIVKIASRCNLNCSYCFVYNRADQQWRSQPGLMADGTIRQTALRIREHCEAHALSRVSIVFHGGEPLLGGVKHLSALTETIREVFIGSNITPFIGMQSNGTLLNEDVARFMHANGMTVGVSLDGPPHVNDRHRLDHNGRPSTARVESNMRELLRSAYRPIFTGFLCVVDIETDPIEVFEYLASFGSGKFDFLLPYDNYDRRPPGKECLDDTPYADWLIAVFDHWFTQHSHIRIREFDSLIRMMLGGHSKVESIGGEAVDLIVVETDGQIEAVDSLKATFDGATKLGYNVFDHSFDLAACNVAVKSRQMGAASLCRQCQECELVGICGGGYIPNRYSRENGFGNPSVYCTDLKKLITHIRRRVGDFLSQSALAV